MVSAETLSLVIDGGGPKGDVLGVAELAGVMGGKRTSDLIPLCHPLPLTHVAVKGELEPPVTVGDIAIKSYVSAVRWTATGEGIGPGEFDTFVIRAGAMPEVESLALPVTQGYSDGTIVDWSEVAELVESSYRLTAPPRLVAELAGGEPGADPKSP